MVRRTFPFLFALLLIATSCGEESKPQEIAPGNDSEGVQELAQNTDLAYPVRYAVKDGKITYRYEGLQSGEETVYFTNWGMTEIKFTDTERENPFKGDIEQISLITFMHDSSIYVVDQLTKNAKKLDNSLLYEQALKSPDLDLNAVAEDMYRAKGGSIVSTDTLLGLPALHWKIKETGMDEWRWKGIMLKTMVDLPQNYLLVQATSIDTVSPLPDGIFSLPKDVNVRDGTSIKEWIEELSKPIEHKKIFDLRDTSKIHD